MLKEALHGMSVDKLIEIADANSIPGCPKRPKTKIVDHIVAHVDAGNEITIPGEDAGAPAGVDEGQPPVEPASEAPAGDMDGVDAESADTLEMPDSGYVARYAGEPHEVHACVACGHNHMPGAFSTCQECGGDISERVGRVEHGYVIVPAD